MSKVPINFRLEFQVMKFVIRMIWTLAPRFFIFTLMFCVCASLSPVINLLFLKEIINGFAANRFVQELLPVIVVMVVVNAICYFLNLFLTEKMEEFTLSLNKDFQMQLGLKMMELDYMDLENPIILNLREQALTPISTHNVIPRTINGMRNILRSAFILLSMASFVAGLNPLLLLFIVGIVLLNSRIYSKMQKVQFDFHKKLAPINRKFGYYRMLASDFGMGKDVRMFGMGPYLLRKIETYNQESYAGFAGMFASVGSYKGKTNITIQVQLLAVYSYMVYKVYTGNLPIGSFLMYISAAAAFSAAFSEVVNGMTELRQMCHYLEPFQQFMELPTSRGKGSRSAEGLEKEFAIEFDKVSFKYPGAAHYTIKNLSFTVRNGENLSIVGKNGAGKSTLIKLLCRLCEPESGEIRVNGINIQEFERADYQKWLAVVFQDYSLFSFSLRDNILLGRSLEHEEQVLEGVLDKMGLKEKINRLDQGVDTFLTKQFNPEGIELSGGEGQKLAIARALAQRAACVVLDEPTAALDPYAEQEIYSHFHELIDRKTALFISHRLSSCQFCNNIAVIENGELVEFGNHAALLNNNGLYAEMWNAQAQFYQE
ncbi:MAG: transporter [Paenibacillaceae bacterium]|jgi:ATP-binding cassette subfamily B protein/ATP-binding cassette subfamily C protein|nr:transporter [Paenibacillaceae bacterium]